MRRTEADMLMAVAVKSAVPIDAPTRAGILEGVSQALRGEFVPDEEIAELWSLLPEKRGRGKMTV